MLDLFVFVTDQIIVQWDNFVKYNRDSVINYLT